MHLDALQQEAHLWSVVPESVRDATTLERCRALLDDQETERYQRFRFADDSHRYLVSHALVRRVLSGYLEKDPADWRFRHNRHGRPEIATQTDLPPLRFNLTHTRGLAACIVTLFDDCGIDAERIDPRHRLPGVARRMFSEPEAQRLQALDDRRLLKDFYRSWTLREAYVKARGIGISFPTRKLRFEIESDTGIRVYFEDEIDDQGSNWQFGLLNPTEQHVAALALRRNGQTDKKIIHRMFEF